MAFEPLLERHPLNVIRMDDLSGSSFEVGWSMYCGRLTDFDEVGRGEVGRGEVGRDDVGSEAGRGVSWNRVR